MRRSHVIVASLLLFACLAVFLFLHFLPTPIGAVLGNPRQYETGEWSIEGVVSERASMLVVRYFKLRDKTGEITVVTNRTLPNVGERLRVHGCVVQTFAIGDLQGIVFEESPVH